MEEEMMQELSVPFYGIMAGKLRRYFSMENVRDWFKIPVGCFQALQILRKLQPKVVFSKGGYVAFPVVVAAWILRIPVVIHESDVRPGLTTKLCSRFATTICLSWEETRQYLQGKDIRITGVPVRTSLLEGNRAKGRVSLGIANDLPLLMVTGGSLGASDINTFIQEQLDWILEQWNVYHLTGKGKELPQPELQKPGKYIQREFDGGDGYSDRLAAADVIISRAGTTALAEFAALGKKVLLIPLPKDRSRGDQIDNAAAYVAMFSDTARVLQQEELSQASAGLALHQLREAPSQTEHTTRATAEIASLLETYTLS